MTCNEDDGRLLFLGFRNIPKIGRMLEHDNFGIFGIFWEYLRGEYFRCFGGNVGGGYIFGTVKGS